MDKGTLEHQRERTTALKHPSLPYTVSLSVTLHERNAKHVMALESP